MAVKTVVRTIFFSLFTPFPLLAQQQSPEQLIARGDTNAAIAAYEAAVRKNSRDTEARYRAGRLYMTRFVPRSWVSEERRRAEAHFRIATQHAPDSAKYWLALAEVFRTEGDVTTRIQIPRLIDRARQAAYKMGSPAVAWVEFRAAQIEWVRYEHLGHRYLFTGTALHVDPYGLMDEWRKVENFLEHRVRPDPGDPGAAALLAAEEHLTAALSADPRHVEAAGLLIVAMGERSRWQEAFEVARRLTFAVPDSGRAHALVGLTLARLGRWRESWRAFTKAHERMTPAQHAPYDNLGLLLRRTEEPRYRLMSPAEQAGLDSLYWMATQPLFLNDVNEIRVEFHARMAYVNHRWSDPERGYQGFESDRGMVYVRYGPPDIWATLGRGRVSHGTPGEVSKGGGGTAADSVLTTPRIDAQGSIEHERNTILWAYPPSQLRFVFSLTPGFARTTWGGDFKAFYREVTDVTPARFDNVPVVRNLDTVVVQAAQFRGDSATDVAVFAQTPIGLMTKDAGASELQLSTGVFVRDARLQEVQSVRRDERIRGGDSSQTDLRSWRLSLGPAEYLMRVEAQIPAIERSARSSAALNVRSFAGDTLMLSDVVVARQITPRDSSPGRWTDFFIDPSGGRFKPGEPVALLWEVYNLTADSAGVARFRVDVVFTVREIERRGFLVRFPGAIGDAVGLSAKGDDKANVSYTREVVLDPSRRHVQHLVVELENALEASYNVSLTVTDIRTGSALTVERLITVSRSPLVR